MMSELLLGMLGHEETIIIQHGEFRRNAVISMGNLFGILMRPLYSFF